MGLGAEQAYRDTLSEWCAELEQDTITGLDTYV